MIRADHRDSSYTYRVIMFLKWTNLGLFLFIFVLLPSQLEFKLKICSACDSNPSCRTAGRSRIHRAMAATGKNA